MRFVWFSVISLLMSFSSVWADEDNDRSDCFAKQDHTVGIPACTRLIELCDTPDLHLYHVYRGDYYTHSSFGGFDKAFAEYGKAIEVNPQSVEAYRSRAELYEFLEDYDMAVTDLNTAISLSLALQEFDIGLYSRRASTLARLERFDEAREDCRAAMRMKPDSGDGQYCLSDLAFFLKDTAERLKWLDACLVVNDRELKCRITRAWILATSPENEFRDGRRAVSEAQQAFSRFFDPEVAEVLAAAYAENGQFTRAVQMQLLVLAWVQEFGNEEAIPYVQERLDLYVSLKPYRDVE